MGTAEEKQLQMIRRLGGFSEQAEIKQFSDDFRMTKTLIYT